MGGRARVPRSAGCIGEPWAFEAGHFENFGVQGYVPHESGRKKRGGREHGRMGATRCAVRRSLTGTGGATRTPNVLVGGVQGLEAERGRSDEMTYVDERRSDSRAFDRLADAERHDVSKPHHDAVA